MPAINTLAYANSAGAGSGSAKIRELLSSARTYYVGFVVGSPTISIASPAVVTLNSHGLSANNQVVFSVLRNTRQVTLSTASPCVATLVGHGLAADRPIKFSSTGWLPSGVVAGTTYYVISTGLTADTFQFSATPGGAAVNSAALTNTFVNGNTTVTVSANHNLVVGQIIRFSGTSVVNVANATNYYVLSTPAANTFTFGATADGSAITPGTVTTQGTFVQNGTHYNTTVGLLPTGITEGTTYFVISAGLTSNAFEISATQGGSAINTSGSVTGSPVYSVRTGSDSNNGLTNSIADAWLTQQYASDRIARDLDVGSQLVTVQMAYGTYLNGCVIRDWVGGGEVVYRGDPALPSNIHINSPTDYGFYGIHTSIVTIRGLRITATGSGASCIVNSFSGEIDIDGCEYGSETVYHIYSAVNGQIYIYPTPYLVSGGAGLSHFGVAHAETFVDSAAISLLGVPSFAEFALVFDTGELFSAASFVGSVTGLRYNVTLGGVINTNGAGSTYFPGNSPGTFTLGGVYN